MDLKKFQDYSLEIQIIINWFNYFLPLDLLDHIQDLAVTTGYLILARVLESLTEIALPLK